MRALKRPPLRSAFRSSAVDWSPPKGMRAAAGRFRVGHRGGDFRPFFVVVTPQSFDTGPGMEQRREPMLVQTINTQPPVGGLNVNALVRLAGLDQALGNFLLVSPRHPRHVDGRRLVGGAVLEHLLGQQLLQACVLGLQVLEPLGVGHAHATELAAPRATQSRTGSAARHGAGSSPPLPSIYRVLPRFHGHLQEGRFRP